MSKEAMKLDKEDITTAKEMAKVLRRSGKDELIVVGMLLDALLKEREEALAKQEQSVNVSNPIGEFPKTVLAVIKEVANRNPKNGLDRWTDYETGAYMQDDADAALLWIKNKAKQEQSTECVGEPVAWEGFTNFANPLGTRLIFITKFEADEWLKDFVEGHAWLKPLSYTTPYVATQRQQRPFIKPLTDEQISDLWCKTSNTDFVTSDTHEFARAIEAAHGIKE